MHKLLYLDTAAATPLDERVFAVMRPLLFEQFYNPSSSYKAARSVRVAYENARHVLAQCMGAKANDIVLTAGATESTNLALHGILRQWPKAHVVMSVIEHQAVLEVARQYEHTEVSVTSGGRVTPEALQAAIRDDTVLVSIGYVNSEVGTVQPLRKLAAVIQTIRAERLKNGNPLPLYLHADASQAAGFADLQVSRLGVDLLTLSASKIGGPKQVGLLYVKTGVILKPLIHGGGQEHGVRSGTENVAGVVGFARALELAMEGRVECQKRLQVLRDAFEKRLHTVLPGAEVNGDIRSRAPHISNISIPGVDAETLLFMLDERGIMVSTGAACAANKGTASHVLTALGLPEAHIQGSLRASFGTHLKSEEVLYAADAIVECVTRLREMAS